MRELDRAKARTPARASAEPSPSRYVGGKNHLWKRLVNLVPQHDRWVEAFAGSAAMSRNLARAAESLVIEKDKAQAARLRVALPGHRVIAGDALPILRKGLRTWGPETVLFADPPYPVADRRSARELYACELTTAEHAELVRMLLRARCRVLVCGMPWGSYARAFRRWHRHEFPVTLRSGKPGVEVVWTNFADPFPLHDYRQFGDDKGARQDFRRVIARNLAKLRALDRHERAALLRAFASEFGGAA